MRGKSDNWACPKYYKDNKEPRVIKSRKKITYCKRTKGDHDFKLVSRKRLFIYDDYEYRCICGKRNTVLIKNPDYEKETKTLEPL